MDVKSVRKLFIANDLSLPTRINKINVGFSNEVYSIDDKYILKICGDKKFKQQFENETYFYSYFKHKLPVPEVIVYDNSRQHHSHQYMIYSKISGDNLYNQWHRLTDQNRGSLVEQLCSYLKLINTTNLDNLPPQIKLKEINDWQKQVINVINHFLAIATKSKTLAAVDIKNINQFVSQNSFVLKQQKIALTFWDPHFDNVLVKKNKIVGLLDLELTEICSIDYVLDCVWRMAEYPKLYMSEYAEHFAKKDDYQLLRGWYKEFYPEVFEFDNLNTRVKLYSLLHDLRILPLWPKNQQLKKSIRKTVS